MNETDQQLLRSYAKDGAEDTFAEIVHQHLDLVYSAALRQVQSPQLAKDVSQSVFTDLARSAGSLKHDTILSAWLYEVTRRTAIDVIRKEARRQLREQLYTEMNAINATTEDWRNIVPHLDDAMAELDKTDRAAVLLRFFGNKSLREVGQELGVSDDAAQKRVSRAVERLREYFAKHGVTVGAGGLVALVSANAVLAAPAGLAVTISTAAALTGTTLATNATITATKAIAMTMPQKTVITIVVTTAVSMAVYQAHQNAQLRDQVKAVEQTLPLPSTDAVEIVSLREEALQLAAQNAELSNALALARADKIRLEKGWQQASRSAVLFKELAAQSSAGSWNGNSNFPSVRHVAAEMGRLVKLSAQLSKQDTGTLSPEEKSAHDIASLELATDMLEMVKAAKRFDAGNTLTEQEKADYGTCFLHGVLGLNEQQFPEVYSLLARFADQVSQQHLSVENPSPEAADALKQLNERANAELRSVLTPEQAELFALVSPHVQLLNGQVDFNFNFGDKGKQESVAK